MGKHTNKPALGQDLIQQLQPNQVEFDYDGGADVLYLSIGAPRPSISESIGEGAMVRYDPDTAKMTGFTYISFTQTFVPSHPELTASVEVLLSTQASGTEKKMAAQQILRRSIDLLPPGFFATLVTGEPVESLGFLDLIKDLQVWVDSLAGEGIRRLITEVPIIVSQAMASYGPLVSALKPARVPVPDSPAFRDRGITGEVQLLRLPDASANIAISLAVGPASGHQASLAVKTETVDPPTPLPRARVTLHDRQHAVLESVPTGPDGTVVFANMGLGDYIFSVKHQKRTWEFPVTLIPA